MRFVYEYRTRDNVRHTGEISAPDREAAFAALKAQGVRPGSVTAAPGFFNRLFGTGKRWLTIGALAVLCVSLVAVVWQLTKEKTSLVLLQSSLDDTMRRQVIGDAAVVELGVKSSWADVFQEPGERFLASYAQPGQPPALTSAKKSDLTAALDRKIEAHPTDGVEARQIKAIVEGLKDEMRAYLAKGGTIEKYVRRLLRRQQTEIGYYQRAKREIDERVERKTPEAEVVALWERRNNELRRMGIRLVPYPDQEEAEP